MAEETSKVVKAGKRTYFFDVKKAKNGEPYLIVTESRFAGEGKERERSSILVFPDAIDDVVQAMDEIAKLI
ncbi:MAG: DUF3276 family protein [Chloroflexi bacterium]|nr:DUF3276 family protein [Chloroflexota bacterium]